MSFIQTTIRKFRENWHLRMLLHNGLKLGKNVYLQTPNSIDYNFCWLISIGDDCLISANVLILAHDASTINHLSHTKVGRVTIGHRTFIGARTIILPGVHIGNDVIIGTGSVVTNNIPDNSVAAGNPARILGSTSEYIKEHRKNLPGRSDGRSKHLSGIDISPEDKKIIQAALKDNRYYYVERARKMSDSALATG